MHALIVLKKNCPRHLLLQNILEALLKRAFGTVNDFLQVLQFVVTITYNSSISSYYIHHNVILRYSYIKQKPLLIGVAEPIFSGGTVFLLAF